MTIREERKSVTSALSEVRNIYPTKLEKVLHRVLLHDPPHTVNMILTAASKQPLPFGDRYGWRNLQTTLFMAKYGIKKYRDKELGSDVYHLELPSPIHLGGK